MDVQTLIDEYAAAILDYERAMPCADAEWLKKLHWHRDFNMRIIADLRRFLP